jgi:hypothetical protein
VPTNVVVGELRRTISTEFEADGEVCTELYCICVIRQGVYVQLIFADKGKIDGDCCLETSTVESIVKTLGIVKISSSDISVYLRNTFGKCTAKLTVCCHYVMGEYERCVQVTTPLKGGRMPHLSIDVSHTEYEFVLNQKGYHFHLFLSWKWMSCG